MPRIKNYSEDYYENLLMDLMSATFHHTDETAKTRYSKKFLYRV